MTTFRTPLLAVLGAGLFVLSTAVSPARAQDGEHLQTIGLVPVGEVPTSVLDAARTSVRGPDGVGKDGPLSAMSLGLAVLYHQHRSAGPQGIRKIQGVIEQRQSAGGGGRTRGGTMRGVHSPISADGQFVAVEAISARRTARLLSELRALGLKNGATVGTVVSGRMPISALAEAAALPALRGMIPSYARTAVGSVGSEADTAHASTTARLNTGTNGNGQKVCALSDSYNTSGTSPSASDDIETGDLPGSGNPEGRTNPVDVLEDYDGTDPEPTDEGRAMLQLIHDIAPGAALGFHTAFPGLANFASGIRELAESGCTVIVDDVQYLVEPFYQDGPVSNAVDEVVTTEGVAYFSSAGNRGQNSYEAPFRNSGEPGVVSGSSMAHDFDADGEELPPTDTRQQITIKPGGTLEVLFQWTDPSALVQGSRGPDTDLDIALVDGSDNVVAQSADDNISNGVPFEFFRYTNASSSAETFSLVIEKAAGPDPEEIKYLYSASGPFTDSDVTIDEYDTLGPTLFGHSMAEGAMAVAAVPFYYTEAYCSTFPQNCFDQRSPPYLEPFSSRGGIPIRFNQDGDPISAVSRDKPDVTGTDGVDNTLLGNDIPSNFLNGVDTDPHPNFFGTSAAAPSVAAIAALVRDARPGFGPQDVYRRLETTAADVTQRINRNNTLVSIGSGEDPWTGHGFVQANKAVPPVNVAITEVGAAKQSSSGSEQAIRLTWRQVGGEDEPAVSEFVVKQRYFDGDFRERARIASTGPGEYSRTIENLPTGRHHFRIEGVSTSAGRDTLLARGAVSTTLRTSGVDLTVYPTPFENTVNLSVTLPEAQRTEQRVSVWVFNALGQRVAVPVLSRSISDSEVISFSAAQLQSLGSGIYFFQVQGETFVETTRAVRVR